MKSVHLPSTKEEKDATRTIQKGSKRAPLKAIRDNLYASHLIDFKRLGPTVREYLKCATEAGIVNEVKSKAVTGYYMMNVSLEKRISRISNKKKKASKMKNERCKVVKSSFDQRSNRSSNDLLYI